MRRLASLLPRVGPVLHYLRDRPLIPPSGGDLSKPNAPNALLPQEDTVGTMSELSRSGDVDDVVLLMKPQKTPIFNDFPKFYGRKPSRFVICGVHSIRLAI